MFKSLTRSSASSVQRRNAGFAETQFLHDAEDADYSGFAPTELFDDAAQDGVAPAELTPAQAAARSRSAMARASASASGFAPDTPRDATAPAAWATSQWVAAQEAKAHAAADQARAVIAAQRRGEAAALSHAGERGVGRLLRGLLPLFIGVTVTVALISAILPLLDKP